MPIIYIIIFFFISYTHCHNIFSSSKYITEITTLEDFEIKLKNNKQLIVLIYSPVCSHCIRFASTYIKLAEDFHDYIPFYSIDGYTNKFYKKMISISGYPNVFFYNGEMNHFDKFIPSYTYNDISKQIRKFMVISFCKYIKYESFVNNTISNIDENKIVAFVDPSDSNFNMLLNNIINNHKNLFNSCYICRNFINFGKDSNLDLTYLNRKVYIYSKSLGFSTFDGLKTYNLFSNDKGDEIYYTNLLINTIKSSFDLYIDLSNITTNINNFSYTHNIIFSFKKEDEKINYLNMIYYYKKITHKDNNDIQFYIYNITVNNKFINKFNFGNKKGMFYSDKTLSSIRLINNTKEIEELVSTNKELINIIKNTNKLLENNKKDINLYHKNHIFIVIIILLILYSIIYFGLKYLIINCILSSSDINDMVIEKMNKKNEYIKVESDEKIELN